ncbi:MAG: pyridoxal-phosphate dependent enzyme [Verrucomicrobia bacterium]|nr:pyridoxal-phosphate dependent enzyme [Verrucomicrobiota bacterium]
MSIWRFADRLPAIPQTFRVSLGEGNTPLLRSVSIGPSLGLENLFFKIESANPTGSYKDRFAACAVSHLLKNKASLCLGTSSGNTGAALAAYSAVAKLPCVLAIVDTAPEDKLQQMLAYGAQLVKIRGFGTDAHITKEISQGLLKLARQLNTEVQISAFKYSANGMAGVQSISWELAEQITQSIDHVFSPSGGGGLTLAIAQGFESIDSHSPAVHCVQPTGNNTIAGPLKDGRDHARSCGTCTSKISGLQVAGVIDGHNTLTACRRSGGTGHLVDDAEVFSFQKRLAREEAIFTEPAGAVALTGAVQAIKNGTLSKKENIVCLVTGSGFKDKVALQGMTADLDCPTVDSLNAFKLLIPNF